MTAVAKLLPCPFCGYDMSADEDGAYQKAGFIGAQTPVWAVTCAGTDCNASVETTSSERSVAAWNRRAALSPAELGGVETEQSIAADCYHWIAECIGTLPGYSVQEHVQTMKETLEACSDFLHDFVPSDEGGCDEAVELARNCRAVLSGRIDQYEPAPRAAEAVTDGDALFLLECADTLAKDFRHHMADKLREFVKQKALTPPSAKGENK